jgi:hypothetical protein
MKAKSATTVGVALLLGLSLTCEANAETERDNRAITDPIKACVAEIGERANYEDADRIVHYVTALDQKNIVQKSITIETAVYVDEDSDTARVYTASCITGDLGKIVKFRLLEEAGPVRS